MVNAALNLIEGSFGASAMVFASLLGECILFIGTGWITVVAARQSVKWGLAAFFLPVIGPALFAQKFPAEAKNPFLVYLSGLAFFGAAIGIFILRALIAVYFTPAVV
jgi:hypothetical protein